MSMPPLLQLIEGRRVRLRKAPTIRPKEVTLHMAVADLLRRFASPAWRWTHFPAGELRDPGTAGKLKTMGTQAGWPDFLLVAPGGRLHALELKRIGEDLSEEQESFRDWCLEADVPFAVAQTIDEVLAVFTVWRCLSIKVKGSPAHGR